MKTLNSVTVFSNSLTAQCWYFMDPVMETLDFKECGLFIISNTFVYYVPYELKFTFQKDFHLK